jgi:hypothetical protein
MLLAGANWGVTRSTVRVSERRGISIVKIIIISTAAFLAVLSVAAATDLPIGKYPVGAVAPAAPARPGALGPGERGGGRVAPGGRAVVAPEQPERPLPEGAGANPPTGVAHGEEREAGGGSPPEHNLQTPAGGQPGAPLGGE